MNKEHFTSDQIRVLKENPYTKTITPAQIRFTDSFKELFWKRLMDGISPADIFVEAGYDPELIGEKRISNVRQLIVKSHRESAEEETSSTAKRMDEMENQMKVLEAQIKALKKYHSGEFEKAKQLMMDNPGSKFKLIHQLSCEPNHNFKITELCQLNGVSRSGYYSWLKSEKFRLKLKEKDREDLELILKAYLTQTCVANHVRPEAYLEYVLNQLMMCQQNPDDLDKLLPFSSDLPEWLKIKE